MMARRLLYFPLLVNEIKRHFGSISRSTSLKENEQMHSIANSLTASQESFVSQSTNSSNNFNTLNTSNTSNTPNSQPINSHTSWFTCKINEKDLILPFHLPIGLIYDLINCFKNESNLPWKIEFHLAQNGIKSGNCSDLLAQVLFFPDESQLSSFYFSSLKEADHLRNGSAKNVMNLSRAEQLQLWDSVKGSDFERFWRINQKLIPNTTNEIKTVPIKFWICDKNSLKITKLQFPITITITNSNDQEAKKNTLKSLLSAEFSEDFVQTKLKGIISHGIRNIPSSILLDELYYNWNYPDNFINLILLI